MVNYTDIETPFTRIIEHKHFNPSNKAEGRTIITKEYPQQWQRGDEPYYPVNNHKNDNLYKQYMQLSNEVPNVIFGGRLGQYRYFNMDQTIMAALKTIDNEFKC